jgi:drug/metabolite transporter (DMT)-like permease
MKQIQTASLSDYALLLLLSTMWASAFVGIEYALTSFDPFFIAFLRIFFASLFLLCVVYIKKLSFPRDLKTWSMLLLLGILNSAMPFYLISWGQQYISAGTSSVMLAMGPFVTLIVSHMITEDEKITFFKIVGVILGFVGVFILLGDDFLKGNDDSLYGKIALIIAVMGYMSSGFLIRKMSHVHTVICSTSMFTTAWIIMSPFLFMISYESFEIVSYPFLTIVYLAIVPTALASLMRIDLVRKTGVQFMSQVSYLIPICTLFLSWLFFDVTPPMIVYTAMAFIFAGLFVRKLNFSVPFR